MPPSLPDPKSRFTGRVDDYVRARPGYPAALVADLAAAGRLDDGSVIADIGAGTGISSALFLSAGYAVIGVEPNAAMREAAEKTLADYPKYRSQAGSAEATGLPDGSVDLIVAAQAFHWFDPAAARTEFRRILRPGGSVALLWNARRAFGSPFLEAYERLLLEFGTDYSQIGHRGVGNERLASFFGGPFATRRYEYRQALDFAGLRSRLLSSSYIPAAGEPAHEAMLERLSAIFASHAVRGAVEFLYDTELYTGELPGLL